MTVLRLFALLLAEVVAVVVATRLSAPHRPPAAPWTAALSAPDLAAAVVVLVHLAAWVAAWWLLVGTLLDLAVALAQARSAPGRRLRRDGRHAPAWIRRVVDRAVGTALAVAVMAGPAAAATVPSSAVAVEAPIRAFPPDPDLGPSSGPAGLGVRGAEAAAGARAVSPADPIRTSSTTPLGLPAEGDPSADDLPVADDRPAAARTQHDTATAGGPAPDVLPPPVPLGPLPIPPVPLAPLPLPTPADRPAGPPSGSPIPDPVAGGAAGGGAGGVAGVPLLPPGVPGPASDPGGEVAPPTPGSPDDAATGSSSSSGGLPDGTAGVVAGATAGAAADGPAGTPGGGDVAATGGTSGTAGGGPGATADGVGAAGSDPGAADALRHVVAAGENLWVIARAALVADRPPAADPPSDREVHAHWIRLIQLNDVASGDPDLIHPGEVLRLPPVAPPTTTDSPEVARTGAAEVPPTGAAGRAQALSSAGPAGPAGSAVAS